MAIDLAYATIKRWSYEEIIALSVFITKKSWWDSVDGWRKIFSKYIDLHPEKMLEVFQLFFAHENFWMRRVSIILQLSKKSKVNRELLTKAILYDQYTEEFFIQKAIGWSLRDYSKFNPSWVNDFLKNHKLSNLAVREASKYLSPDL